MICKLCLNEKKLCKSHIIPEFFYQSLYDNLHRYCNISTDPNKTIYQRQKGIWERLFCSDCEALFNHYETYSSKVLRGGTGIEIVNYANKIVISGIAYHIFKLFQLSLLWRSGVSSRSEFSNISLGHHSEYIREMLLTEQPGEPYEYGCIIIATPSVQDTLQCMIMPPEPLRVDGHRCYRFLLGGLFWVFVVSSHSHQLVQRDIFLTKDGSLPIYKENEKSVEFIRKLSYKLTMRKRLEA